ncbi:hypothetical protein PHYPSEUDO_010903 [Phytophthora pseudosyringae]|uniref:Uncharacterized protein n=1 Tax=Phytophthora pseudosyringae TaxID=221518 RepID=A0A8T1VC92_9STRA|nr:hypothetical protein PHYPSEUDO_010903 [Phytophthora pseudosyringae]
MAGTPELVRAFNHSSPLSLTSCQCQAALGAGVTDRLDAKPNPAGKVPRGTCPSRVIRADTSQVGQPRFHQAAKLARAEHGTPYGTPAELRRCFLAKELHARTPTADGSRQTRNPLTLLQYSSRAAKQKMESCLVRISGVSVQIHAARADPVTRELEAGLTCRNASWLRSRPPCSGRVSIVHLLFAFAPPTPTSLWGERRTAQHSSREAAERSADLRLSCAARGKLRSPHWTARLLLKTTRVRQDRAITCCVLFSYAERDLQLLAHASTPAVELVSIHL